MKRIIIILLLFCTNAGKAQDKEHFALFTDRDLYTSGETVLFHVFVPASEGSAMINVNLINIRGKIISTVSKKIIDAQAEGFLYLPDSMKTDTYLLCSSTRNSQELTVKELFICNRFTGLAETSTLQKATGITPFVDKVENEILIEGISPIYHAREKVQVTMRLPASLLSNMKDQLFVVASESTHGYAPKTFPMKSGQRNLGNIEREQIVVDGIAKDLSTNAPFKNGFIFLSIPDSIPWLDYFKTVENGYFHFQLKDYYGKVPIVVQGIDTEKKQLFKVDLFQEDSIKESVPAFVQWNIPTDIKLNLENTIEANTLRKIFNCQEILVSDPSPKKRHEYPFYGLPTETVYPALFIDLPDFTEISRELLPGVKFRAFNRIPTLQILNPATLNYFVDPPLVTLDGIPIHDLNVIKNMGSKDIERIEICRKERYYGDLIFPGVVAIYSLKRDNKRLTESADLIKKELNAVQPDAVLLDPKDQLMNQPDLRKVLLWTPSVKAGAIVKFDFLTSDIKGSFKLVVRGKANDGSVFIKEQTFEVK